MQRFAMLWWSPPHRAPASINLTAKRTPNRGYAFEPLDILLAKSRDATSTLRPPCFFWQVLQICRWNSVLGNEQMGAASGETRHDPGGHQFEGTQDLGSIMQALRDQQNDLVLVRQGPLYLVEATADRIG